MNVKWEKVNQQSLGPSIQKEWATVLEGKGKGSWRWYSITLEAIQNKKGFTGCVFASGDNGGYANLFKIKGKSMNDVKKQLLKKFYSSLKV